MNPIFDHIRSTLTPVYGPDEARELAFWVLEEACGLTRADVLACKDTKNISNTEIFLQRLLKKEPIQYIFGHILWFGLDLEVNSSTLIPRPETAELVEWVTATNPAGRQWVGSGSAVGRRVLDIGTGSGCIAIAIKHAHPNWEVTGIDISVDALSVAAANARRNHVNVTFHQCDILNDPIPDQYDIVVSNPPYICEEEKAQMDDNVLLYEPHTALFVPNDDPLRFYRRIAELNIASELYFEINERFGPEMQQMLSDLHYTDIQIKCDQYGKTRMVYARTQE